MVSNAKRGLWCAWLVSVAACLCAGEKPLTEEECSAFAKKIEQGIQKGEADALNRVFDLRALSERVTADIKCDPKFVSGFNTGMTKNGGSGGRIAKQVEDGGQFKFLRIHQVENETRALFRLSSDEGVNYHDLILTQGPNGIVVDDDYIFLGGERFSATIKRLFIQLAQQQGLLDKVIGKRNEYLDSMPLVGRMMAAVQNQKPQDGMAAYKQLPESVQKDKMVMLIWLQLARQVGDKEYNDSIRKIEETYPEDPSLLLIRLDGFFLNKDYDGALRALDKLEKHIGPDAYIHVSRANAYIEKKDMEHAKQWAAKAIETDPAFLNGYWSMISVHLKNKSYGDLWIWTNRSL